MAVKKIVERYHLAFFVAILRSGVLCVVVPLLAFGLKGVSGPHLPTKWVSNPLFAGTFENLLTKHPYMMKNLSLCHIPSQTHHPLSPIISQLLDSLDKVTW